jgi:restriction system protein
MGGRHPYRIVLYNEYLGKTKVITAATWEELEVKKAEQERKWSKEEQKKREKERIEALKKQAENDTKKAQETIHTFKSLLKSSLNIDHTLDWESLKDKRKFKPFTFDEKPPELLQHKEHKILEFIFKSLKEKRLKKNEELKKAYEKSLKEYEKRKENAKKIYEKEKKKFKKKQKEHNESIDKLKRDFETGKREAIKKYVSLVLERSSYPRGFKKEFEVQYDPNSEIIVVSYELPQKDTFPKVVEYKYVASKKAVKKVEMKPKEFDAFYEDVLYQICLRTIHEIFEAVDAKNVKSVVFNGWIKGVDPKTGNDFHSCIISCQASREEFESYNLERVSPKECFRSLKGISAGPLAQLAPVRPIMDIKKEDSRFIESREVIEDLKLQNLATIDWADFEQLVRELFEKYFAQKYGISEVRVTRASRDKGVDAIAYDPDPIRGGKIIIQAKRYNDVVPVSAVRELYGTIQSEGAIKGILVTTSYYGNDSREYAKDKPITLLDGSNLIHMFQEVGYSNITIELQPKKDRI